MLITALETASELRDLNNVVVVTVSFAFFANDSTVRIVTHEQEFGLIGPNDFLPLFWLLKDLVHAQFESSKLVSICY